MMMTRNVAWTALGAAGIVLAAGGFWAGKSLTTATITPTVQTGTVGMVGINADEFTIRHRDHTQTGYSLPDPLAWRNAYGTWTSSGRPDCLPPLSHGQRITFGVVSTAPVGKAPGGPVIVWIECPSRPIPHFPIVTPPAVSAPPTPTGNSQPEPAGSTAASP